MLHNDLRSTISPIRARRTAAARAAFSLIAGAACGHDETTAPEPVEPGDIPTATVDASKGWVYFSLDAGSTVPVANPGTSSAWDIAFSSTSVMLNGGYAGPGGVSGYCLCQNSATNPTDATILAYTADGELDDLANVTSSSIPSADSFRSEDLTPAVTGWYTGSGATAQAATDKAWLLRLNDGKSLAKVRVTALTQSSVAIPGKVTIEYAVQPEGSATVGETHTLDVIVSTEGQTRVDLTSGEIVTSSDADWDIAFEGWLLRLNGGVSGTASAAATPATEPFDGITDINEITAPQAFKTDAFAGVFAASPWYRYNLTGMHDITPVFDVYLLRRGNQVYKLQITDYYGPAGETRQITFRYTPVTN